MAIEFNRRKNVGEVRIGNELPKAKDLAKEEVKEQVQIDNKFVKEFGDELLASVAAVNVPVKKSGVKIDKDFWGDALNGLNLKDTTLAKETTERIERMDNTFAILDMEQKMAKSPFIQALNREFGIE